MALSRRYAVMLILLLCLNASLASPAKQSEFKRQEIITQDVKLHQKRIAVSSVIAAISAAGPIISLVKDLGNFIYGIVQSQQNITEMKKINDNLLVIEEKLDALSSEMTRNMRTLINGQRWLEGAITFSQAVQRLKYFLHLLNRLQPDDETGRLQPADQAEEWADAVLDVSGRSIGQTLFSVNDMMVGTTHLFGHKPLFQVYLSTIDQDSEYWHKAREFIEYTYTLQVMGYAAWATAYNIKGLTDRVPPIQKLANTRLTKQEAVLEPLTIGWPTGLYGTPMTNTGCPEPDGDTWQPWVTGWRKQDTVDVWGHNRWSADNHFPVSFHTDNMKQMFCMRRDDDAVPEDWKGNGSWPSGSYCLFSQGGSCPAAFNRGYIRWDDEDIFNSNSKGGVLPDGTYDKNTIIYYCCRSDGEPTSPISLPTRHPFYLFRYKNRCQEVKSMNVREEWFLWDTECRANIDKTFEATPDETGSFCNIILNYCYYSPTV